MFAQSFKHGVRPSPARVTQPDFVANLFVQVQLR